MIVGNVLILRFFSALGLPSRVFLGIPRPALARTVSALLSPMFAWAIAVAFVRATLVPRAAMPLTAAVRMTLGALVLSPALEAVPGSVFVGAEWLALGHLRT